MADKVKFGIKNVHYAVMTTEGPELSYETPVAIPGAVSFSMEPQGDSTSFNADDTKYFVFVSNNGYSGDLEMALFPDQFQEDVYGVSVSENDKVAVENARAKPKRFALLFEEEGDATGTKFVLYNCVATRPSRTLSTTTDTTEPQTQKITVTASPLADGRSAAWTTEETPAQVRDGWYDAVWTEDTTAGAGG